MKEYVFTTYKRKPEKKHRLVRFNIIKESSNVITPYKNDYLFSDHMIPVRRNQAYEEMLDLEKRFAGEIYYQRCLDKRL